MKIRNGFVSNSSSSSFLVGSKNKPTKEDFMKAFKVPTDSPLYSFIESIALWFAKNIREIDEDEKECWEDTKIFEIIQDKNMKIFIGYAANDRDDLETAICYMAINIATDDLIVEKEEGF